MSDSRTAYLSAICETPGCEAPRALSGLCEIHYWKREAERLSVAVDAATARETDLRGIVCAVNDADTDNMIGEIKVTRPDGSRTWLPDRVLEVLRAHAQEPAAPHQPLSLTRETVLNLTPRAAKPPPTLAPPIDVAVEKEGKR